MNQSSSIDKLRDATNAYAQTIDIPPYDERAIRARTPDAPRQRAAWRPAVAIAAAVVVVVLLLDGRSVVAQVESVMRAFLIVNGQTQSVAVNTVTLDRARHDMPFTVIAPAGLPAGFQPEIREVVPGNSPLESRLMFQYANSNGPPLTITESRVMPGPQTVDLLMTKSANGAAVPVPPVPPLQGASGQRNTVEIGSGPAKMVRFQPIAWTVSGTRIELIAPPGMLTSMQIAAIERSMR
jgi:hypothetical protein